MADRIVDGSFEIGDPVWVAAGVLALRTQVDARLGTWSFALSRSKLIPPVGFPIVQSGSVYQNISTVVGLTYSVLVFVNGNLAGATGALRITFGDATVDLDGGETWPDAWLAVELVTTATTTTTRLQLETVQGSDSGSGLSSWLVDDVRVEDMAWTWNIVSAIETDLATITTGNGYALTVAEVKSEPVPLEKARTPGLYMFPEGGSSDPASVTARKGETTQRVTMELFTRTAAPHEEISNLLDDVRNCLEDPDKSPTLWGLGLIDATVSQWTPVVTSTDLANQWGRQQATVEVKYLYTRGSA